MNGNSGRSPVEGFIDQFASAAAAACRLELRVRMFADMHDDLRAVTGNLENIEDAILLKYAADLTDTEKAAVRGARRVRNKVLHCEFWTAEARLAEHGVPPGPRTVHAGDLTTGAVRRVEELEKHEPRIFGWLLEGACGGLFEQSETLFHEAIQVILRLANLGAAQQVANAQAQAPITAEQADDFRRLLEQLQKGARGQ